MANSVESDQTAEGAVWSGSVLFAYSILSDSLVYKSLDIYRRELDFLKLFESHQFRPLEPKALYLQVKSTTPQSRPLNQLFFMLQNWHLITSTF